MTSKFPLQQLIAARAVRRDRALREVQSRQAELAARCTQRDAAHRRWIEIGDERMTQQQYLVNAAGAGETGADGYARIEQRLLLLNAQMEQQANAVAQAEQRVAEARQQVAEALSVFRAMQTKLDALENQKRRWRAEVQRASQRSENLRSQELATYRKTRTEEVNHA